MPLNNRTTTARFENTTLSKADAKGFTVQVSNQTVVYQLNIPPFGNGENWVPIGGANLLPGFWTFDATDFSDYGADTAQGIRFRAIDVADPANISVS